MGTYTIVILLSPHALIDRRSEVVKDQLYRKTSDLQKIRGSDVKPKNTFVDAIVSQLSEHITVTICCNHPQILDIREDTVHLGTPDVNTTMDTN